MYYNLIDKETHKFSGITSIKNDGFLYTNVPVKPLLYNQDEAVFDFNSNTWTYNFEKCKSAINETPYSLIGYYASSLYYPLYPKNGSIILPKEKDISVLIPCYNKSDYIEECVISCLHQTMPPKNIVILLMDEKSIKLKDTLQSLDESVICIESERMNVCKARTSLVNLYCPTDWFIFLDADDTLSENCIGVLYNMDCSLSYVVFHEEGIHDIIPNNFGLPSTSLTLNMTCLMNKKIFNDIGLDESLCNGGEDFDFNIRAFSDTNYKIGVTYDAWYNYRNDSNGLSKRKEFFESHFKAVVKNIEFLHSEFVTYYGYKYIENEFYKNPTIDTLYNLIGSDYDIIVAEKRDLIKYKLYLSKYHDPLSKYSDDEFVYLNTDVRVDSYDLINKTFDVLFLENVNESNIFEDIPMLINKSILPYIEGKKGWNLINYLVDNYSCFDIYDITKVKTFEEIYEEMKQSVDKNDVIQEQLRLLSLKKVDNINEKISKDDNYITLSLSLHKQCNLLCDYCYQSGYDISPLSDDEIYCNFDKALTYFENKYKVIHIQLLGGEPTIWTDYLINKILDRLDKYRNIMVFSNGTNRDSLWYKSDKVMIQKHVTDWEKHPENVMRKNLLVNEIPALVITNDNISLLEKYIEEFPEFRGFIPLPCMGSPNPSQNLTDENIRRLLDNNNDCYLTSNDMCEVYNTIDIDCVNMQGRYCCKYPNSVIYTDIKEDYTQCEKCPLNKYRLYKEGNNNV